MLSTLHPPAETIFGDLEDTRKTINLSDPVLQAKGAHVQADQESRIFPAWGAVYERTVLKLFRKKDK